MSIRSPPAFEWKRRSLRHRSHAPLTPRSPAPSTLFERDEDHDPTRKYYLHCQDPHYRRAGSRYIPQRRRPFGGPAFTSRRLRRRHQPRAAVCGWMVGLFHQRDENSSRQNESGPPGCLAIDAEVDVGPTPGAYGLAARLNVTLPGIEAEVAQHLLDATDQLCPYSNATRGNIDVRIKLV